MGAKYLHIPAVSQFSEPGKWFDPSGGDVLHFELQSSSN